MAKLIKGYEITIETTKEELSDFARQLLNLTKRKGMGGLYTGDTISVNKINKFIFKIVPPKYPDKKVKKSHEE
jgi:hypothetical protein